MIIKNINYNKNNIVEILWNLNYYGLYKINK